MVPFQQLGNSSTKILLLQGPVSGDEQVLTARGLGRRFWSLAPWTCEEMGDGTAGPWTCEEMGRCSAPLRLLLCYLLQLRPKSPGARPDLDAQPAGSDSRR